MKLITLNIWGGRIGKPLLEFLRKNNDVDIFCFQEVYHNATDKSAELNINPSLNIFTDIQNSLPHHLGFFRPVVDNVYGIAMFVNNSIAVIEEKDSIIHENKTYPGHGGNHSRNLQWIIFEKDDKMCAVVNVHGLWNGQGKTDTPDRIAQSEKIKTLIDKLHIPKIVCGDFNLLPDTESLKIVEVGLTNLITKYGITSTRTSHYTKPEKFADYILISPEIHVKDFKVLPVEVSDHRPLFLEF